jgi:hypothetical protein
MNYVRRQFSPARLVFLVAVLIVTIASVVKVTKGTGVISKGDLAGAWQATLVGSSGCGTGSLQINFVLSSAGSGPATLKGHSTGCGNSTTTGQTFTVSSLGSTGSGTASVSCGVGCGFSFAIQVSPDRTTFNLVDLTDPIPNIWAGVAIHQ